MKCKDMILSDFLLEVIPISFNMYNTLYENYYSIEMGD